MRTSRAFRHSVGALLAWALFACEANVDLGGSPGDAAADGADGATCATYAPPATTAPCTACSPGPTCQPNGCFNGYYCDVSLPDCKPPGTTCSSTAKFDAQ